MRSLNPLWRTFLFIVVSSLIIAGTVVYIAWSDIKSEASTDLVYANRIMTNSIQSVLHKNEALLKVLGERLVELGALQHASSSSLNLVNSLLENNSELAGIGLADLSGQLVLTSFNIDRKNLPNLLRTPETAGTFRQAVNTQSMVVGRTYYMKALSQWVIPLRVRITNSDGKVVAVMTTGLKLDSAQTLWSNTSLPDHMQALVVRKDLYRQYVPSVKAYNMEAVYYEPTSEDKRDLFESLLISQTGMDLATFRDSGKIISMVADFGEESNSILTSVSYDSIYNHYTFIFTPLGYLYGKLLTPISWVMVLLLLFNAVLYWIIRSNIHIHLNSEKNLELQATHDELTELPNRRYLLKEYSVWKDRHDGGFSVIFFDLDNFKSVNDLHGHSIGDKVLCEIASRVNDSFENSLNVRQGGDEFIVLSAEKNQETIFSLCRKCLDSIKRPIIIGDLNFSIGASVGVSSAPMDGADIDTLLRKADMAMYEAKREQLGICFFSERLEDQQKRKSMIEGELVHAIERDEFLVVYQPQIDAVNHSLMGIEALIRWNNPVLGVVSPQEFIPIAETAGIIIDIGLYVLETALKDLSWVLKKTGSSKNIRLSVNVSVRQLLGNDFLEWFANIKNRPEYSDIDLVIEVTENLFIEDMDKVKFVLEKMHQIGIGVSLDDFGTGYSSLNVLNKLPISELKIDKSFVHDIMVSDQDKKLIRSIIDLAKSLEIPVLAEGVEDRDQADFLAENGCDLFQGYYFSRPLERDKLIDYIANSK